LLYYNTRLKSNVCLSAHTYFKTLMYS